MCIEIVNSMGAPNHVYDNFVKNQLVTNLFKFVHVFKKNENINKIEQNSTIVTSQSNKKNAVIPEPFTLLLKVE